LTHQAPTALAVPGLILAGARKHYLKNYHDCKMHIVVMHDATKNALARLIISLKVTSDSLTTKI
jgi:hypothetical protein